MRTLPVVPRVLRAALIFVLCAGFTAWAAAHVRLRYTADQTPLHWTAPESIGYHIQVDGSDDISDGSHLTAIRAAAEAWNMVHGSRARLLDQGTTSRTDWQSPEVHVVLFDEEGTSGFFSGASGIVAITPITFYTDGRIADADVIFNGKNFRFATDGRPGHFDVQDVAAHELGHLLGLDHSGVSGATMYPYVDPTVILHRSLSLDDEHGMRAVYPASSFARISGALERAGDGSAVAGAHVVARDADGRVVAAILSGSGGGFQLQGLDPGTYTLYADPLDQPVNSGNLGGGQTVHTDFQTTDLGTVTVAAGAIASVGTHAVAPDAAVQLGRVSDDYPQRAIRGATVTRVVRGTGLVPGSSLTCSDPTIALTGVTWNSSNVLFDVTVPAGAAPGHVDLVVTDPSGARDTLVAGLEITPPDPAVTGVSPAVGTPAGGDVVTLTGTGFRPGARVVIGDRVYRDGDTYGCDVVDETTIQLTTGATIAGSHDVVVIDSTGVEGRSDDAFVVDVAPTIATTFPTVGTSSGGTRIVLTGQDFTSDLSVTIDGVPQFQTSLVSPTRLDIVTTGGVPGGPYVVRLETPGGHFAETAFTYIDGPDPEISFMTPDEADRSGGATISLFGNGFDSNTRVVFGVNPRTGAGGTEGGAVEVVDSTLVRVAAPSSSVGTKSILVKNVATGQVATVEAGFTFTGQPDFGDDGGGCATVIPPGPPTARDVIGGGGWILVAFAIAYLRASRRPVPARARA